MKLTDLAWIVALSTWVPELIREGVLSQAYGWLLALFFVIALAGSRISESSFVGKALHLSVPIAALLALFGAESASFERLEAAIASVLPMLGALCLIYVLITGAFSRPKSD